MTDFNRVVIAGTLTRDPDLKYTPSGSPVCDFTVAINHTWKTDAGEKKENAIFVNTTAWGKIAENVAEYMKKGRSVLIEGRLQQERWTTKEGDKRTKLSVVASIVRFLGSAPQGDGGQQPIDSDEAKKTGAQSEQEGQDQ